MFYVYEARIKNIIIYIGKGSKNRADYFNCSVFPIKKAIEEIKNNKLLRETKQWQ